MDILTLEGSPARKERWSVPQDKPRENTCVRDSCRLLGIYNDKDVYLYSSAKYDRPRIFYTPNYYYLPKFIVDHEKLTLLQAVKIINYRMKNNDSDNLKPEELKIDTVIASVKNKK